MTVAVALSGGVDSSVALLKLLRTGREVRCFILKMMDGAKTEQSILDANKVADHLDVELEVVDIRKQFEEIIVNNFLSEYQRGRTPNPCVLCNDRIKFGLLREHASKLGCKYLATGHYARIREIDGEWSLLRAESLEKDQAYALYRLKREELQYTIFPLGGLSKWAARELARTSSLPISEKEDSQDICFVDVTYLEVLLANGISPKPGKLVRSDGKVLGTHRGFQCYTIGQRRNLGFPGGAGPYYVIEINPRDNLVIVGLKDELLASRFEVTDTNWLVNKPETGISLACEVKIRYRSPMKPGTVTIDATGITRVELSQPHNSITPGQSAVFFREDRVLGGGIISKVNR